MSTDAKGWRRMAVSRDRTIAVPADEAWRFLQDWAAILDWWDPATAPAVIARVDLIGAPNAVPRTRRIFGAGDSVVDETLLKSDAVARRIYYDMDDDGLPGIRNYLATTTVDVVNEAACRMRFSSTFDVPEGVDEAWARALVESIYDAIADGYSWLWAGRAGG